MNFKQFLKGTWKLESFTSTDENGVTVDAMGPGVTGFISYSHDGWVSVEIMKPDRPLFDISDVVGGTAEQTLSAARGLFCYGGPYNVDEENGIAYHHLEFSLIPNWVGSKQKRYINKEGDNVMILRGDPVLINGKIQTTRLRWLRYRPDAQTTLSDRAEGKDIK